MNNEIERVISTQCKTKTLPQYFSDLEQSWYYYYPKTEFTHLVHDDEENLQLVKNHYPQYLESYNNFAHNIERSDFARYLFLHHEGGIYHDTDYESMINFYDKIKNYDFVVVRSNIPNDKGFQNSLMASKKGCDFWLKVCDYIVARYRKRSVKLVIHTTGPAVLSVCVNFYGPNYNYYGLPVYLYLGYGRYKRGLYANHYYTHTWHKNRKGKNYEIEPLKCVYTEMRTGIKNTNNERTLSIIGWILIIIVIICIIKFIRNVLR